MSAQVKALQERYFQAAGDADISGCVVIARGLVRQHLTAIQGIDIPDDLQALVDELAGPDGPDSDRVARDTAAVMIGIAIGQFYHPDVFKGGAR